MGFATKNDALIRYLYTDRCYCGKGTEEITSLTSDQSALAMLYEVFIKCSASKVALRGNQDCHSTLSKDMAQS